MQKYTVTKIAKLMNVNEETVRRWIRAGQLKATMTSKKEGNVIEESDLMEFIRNNPKYGFALSAPEAPARDVYSIYLNNVLTELTMQRDMLNERINKIQSLLKEL